MGSKEKLPMTTEIVKLEAALPAIQSFDPTNPAAFGNSFLASILAQTQFDQQVAEAQEAGDKVRKFIGFETCKAVMHAAETTELNIFAIFEGGKAVEKYNTKLLIHWGIIKREIVDDEIKIAWTSKEMEEAYDYSAIDKEKNQQEYDRRFNNRKRLNMRISDATKMAVALVDDGVKHEQLKLIEDAETKQVEAVIENAPATLRGDMKNNANVKFGARNANEGAALAPNVASLVKAATEKHRVKDTGTGERADKGSERSGDAKLGMSDEDFGGIVNNLRRAVDAQEANLTDEMIKHLVGLVPYIDEAVKKSLANPDRKKVEEAPTAEAKADEKAGEDLSNAIAEKENGKKGKKAEKPATAEA